MSSSQTTLVRPYEDRDEEAVHSVRSLTYNDGMPIPEDRRKSRYSDSFVAEADGKIAGVFNVLPMNATRGPALLECGGVAGVAVSPDLRRSGVGLTMMKWLPGYLRKNGVQLASLYAFRETFYAKAGYAVVGKRFRISAPVHRLPKVDTKLPIRRLSPSDWKLLHECYEKFGHARSGVHIRSELMWERVLNENKPLTIYAAGDPIEGYVAVSHQVAFWVEQGLSEVTWSTGEGYKACLAIMHQIGINKSEMVWSEPSDSPYYASYIDQGVNVEVARPVMFRVCDVKGGLERLKPHHKGSFTLAVDDPDVPENRGPFKVEWSGGEVRVSEHAGEPDVEASISAFSQAFLGDPSLADLSRLGLIRVKSEAALEAAEQLLPPLPVFCGDFF